MDLLITQKELDTADRIQLGFSYLLQLVLVVFLFVFLARENWLNAFLTFGILLLTFIPKFIRHNYHVFLPVEFDLLAILFIFMTLFLGELHSYYTLFWWWDLVLHTSSGFLLGIAGFLLVYVLNEEKRVHVKMKPGFVAIFAFVFAVAIGAVWEIVEFTIDSTTGLQTQHGSLTDTMWDLIVDSLGAFIIAVIGYFYTRKGQFLLFDRMVHRFVERNPRIFEKIRRAGGKIKNVRRKFKKVKGKLRTVKGKVKGHWQTMRQRKGGKIIGKAMVAVMLLVIFITACKSGNQVTGSSAFVENPEELPVGRGITGVNDANASSASGYAEKGSNWITGIVE